MPFADPEKRRAWKKSYYLVWRKRNPEYSKLHNQKRRMENPDKVNRAATDRHRLNRDNLADEYICSLLADSCGLKRSEIPADLIQAQRLLLRARRNGLITGKGKPYERLEQV